MAHPRDTIMTTVGFGYALACYAIFLLTFAYSIGFVGALGVPRTVDAGGPTTGAALAVAINVGLLAAFGLQHSIMARPAFKRLWTRIVPPHLERSTYVLLSSLALALLYWQWRPLPAVLWDAQAPLLRGALWGLFGLGWSLVLLSSSSTASTAGESRC